MTRILAVLAICLWLPGCAVFGIGLAAVAVDNIMQGEESYTNEALDKICDATSKQKRHSDGSCPPAQQTSSR